MDSTTRQNTSTAPATNRLGFWTFFLCISSLGVWRSSFIKESILKQLIHNEQFKKYKAENLEQLATITTSIGLLVFFVSTFIFLQLAKVLETKCFQAKKTLRIGTLFSFGFFTLVIG
ncbi:MAG: hypothetical protein QM632_03790, partial [Micrococcaceae bacterium]